MDYGDIFAGTFRTLWRHKALWLLAVLAQILPAVTALLVAAAVGRFLGTMLRPPLTFTGGLGPAFAAACLLVLLGLAGYVVHLIMRGGVINEAGIAWSGNPTGIRRGISTGGRRAIYLFGLDLLWYVPILVLAGIAYAAIIGAAITAIANFSRSGGQNAGLGPALLAICGLACCFLLLGLGVAVFYGIFAPLMYQSAVQLAPTGRRRTLSEAIRDGWQLARGHPGAMVVFWLLVAVVTVVAGALMRALAYPLSASLTAQLTSYLGAFTNNPGGDIPIPPSGPPANSAVLIVGGALLTVLGILVYGFVEAFSLTLYAAVYRRLSGSPLSASLLGRTPPPHSGGPSAPGKVPEPGASRPPIVPPVESGTAAGTGAGAEMHENWDMPPDLGLTVPGDTPGDENSSSDLLDK